MWNVPYTGSSEDKYARKLATTNVESMNYGKTNTQKHKKHLKWRYPTTYRKWKRIQTE